MDVGGEDPNWQIVPPDTVQPAAIVQGLRCPVCLDYFTRPHTLTCGHTFCLRCLRTLARVTRRSRERCPLERLRFRCPSCRKLTPARMILRRRASVNYALNELVDEWFNSPYSTGSVATIKLRSVAAQTDSTDVDVSPDTDNPEQNDTNIAAEEFREILFHRIQQQQQQHTQDASDKLPDGPLTVSPISLTLDESSLSEDVDTSSSETESELEIPPLLGLRVIAENRPRFRIPRFHATSVSGVLRMFFQESMVVVRGIRASRSRAILTVFWFLYGMAVVCVSRGFLPWMAFYTVVYFLILYAEMSQPAFFRG